MEYYYFTNLLQLTTGVNHSALVKTNHFKAKFINYRIVMEYLRLINFKGSYSVSKQFSENWENNWNLTTIEFRLQQKSSWNVKI